MKPAIRSFVSVVVRLGVAAGVVALGAVACGGSNQAPPATAAEQSAQNSASPPSTAAPVVNATGTNVWGVPDRSSDAPPSSWSTPSAHTDTAGSGSPAMGHDSSTGSTAALTSAGPPSDAEIAKLDDAELAAVVEAVDDGEIRLAQLAEAQTTNLEVKRFARDMVVAHQSMRSRDKAFLSQINIGPTANAISNRLNAATQNEVTELTSLHGDAFDHAYVDMQVRDHSQAIDLFDRIIPNVKNASLKAQLTAARPKLQAHLRMAESVQSSVEKGVTNRQPTLDKP